MSGCWPRCPCCGQLLPWPHPYVPWRPNPRPCPPRNYLAAGEAVAQAREALGVR